MKKYDNKGFTLIELLAVIVVLAIVLLIAVPAIGNVIEKSKKGTFESSAKGLIDAAKYFHSKNILSLSEEPYVFSFNDGKKGEAVVDEKTYKLAYSGQAPSGGNLTLRDDGKIELYVCNDTYCACKSYDSVVVSIVNTEVENCGLNEDGTVADNPIFSNELEELREDYEETREDFEDLRDSFLDKTYPVGSIYMSKNNTNPGTLFGGTWVTWGNGRVPVGVNTSDSAFNTVEKTGGEKTHVLTIAEMPSHTHIQNAHTHSINHDHASATANSNGAHTHTFSGTTSSSGNHSHTAGGGGFYAFGGEWTDVGPAQGGGYRTSFATINTSTSGAHTHTYSGTTSSSGAHTHTVDLPSFSGTSGSTTATNQNTGGDDAHNNLQPYITVYMWKRTN